MTQREKIYFLKKTICYMYEKEGRSKSYVSRVLDVDRKTLSNIINYEWELEQAQIRYLTPSNQKFLNRHKNLIKSRLDNDITIIDIAKELGVSAEYISRTIVPQDEVLKTALEHYHNRAKKRAELNLLKRMNKSSNIYGVSDLKGEVWKEILGYSDYYISNKGRVKRYVKTYDDYMLISTHPNKNNGRFYVWLSEGKGFQVARLVGFAFVNGHSREKNTINHINGDVSNNCVNNLEWMSQAENNKHSYDAGRPTVKAYQRYGRFKRIVLNDKYEFSTITALAKFLGYSETQTRRYIDGDVKSNPYKFNFIY